ncbi:MAG: hypothetical protein PHZ03_09305 [Syntrophomonas sp.]|nr:hypothetical protein [Syntrophomonas sp.]
MRRGLWALVVVLVASLLLSGGLAWRYRTVNLENQKINLVKGYCAINR